MPVTITVKLPQQKKKAVDNLFQHTLLFAGEKKIGKTSFVTQWPDHFMLECEPGNASHLTANYEDVFSFDQGVAYIKAVENAVGYCKVLIIDEIQALYDYCCAKVREEQKLDLDEKFGYVQWGIVKNYFNEVLLQLQRIQVEKNIGVVFTAHLKNKESETRTGKRINRLEPQLSGQCNEALERYVKFCGVMLSASDASRYMQIQGDDLVLAYNGFPDHFLYNGKRLTQIAMGFDPVEGFANFNLAYNNQYVPTAPTVSAPKTQNSQTKPTFVFNKKG